MSDLTPTSRPRESLPPSRAKYTIWFRPDRPKIVAMAGFLCLALGYVGFVLKGSGLPALFSDMKWLNPNYKPMPLDRVQFSIYASFLFIDLAFHLVCIAGAIGVLKMRHWGRRTLIWYAGLGAVYLLIKTAWQIHMFDFMLDFQLSTTTQPLFDRDTMANRQFFALVVMTAIQLAWSAVLILLFTNRFIIDRFTAAEAGTLAHGNDWESTQLSR